MAIELKLPTFGQTIQLENGKRLPFETILGDSTVGPIRLQHFAVRAENFHYNATEDTKIVGVLGYDFLASNAFKLDFANGTLGVVPATQFVAPSDAIALPMTLDDGVPTVAMSIGEGIARHVVFDNGMPFTLVFGSYGDAHTADFTDLYGGERHSAAVPFADDRSYGTQLQVWMAWSPTCALQSPTTSGFRS